MAQASKSFENLKDQAIFVFQNMFVWRSQELKKYMSNNYVRVGLYSKNKTDIPSTIKNTMGGIVDATPKCLDTAILEIQDAREQKLFFIAEEFGRKTKQESYSPESFDFLKELGKYTKNRTKGNRALVGLTSIAAALAPKPSVDKKGNVDPSYFNGVDTENPKKVPGPDLPLVNVQGKKIQGRIQTMNAKVYDTTNIRQELSSGIPQSIIDSCSIPYVSQYDVRGNNSIINLGKNLFDFESLVHVGYLNAQDKKRWENFLEDPSTGFLNKQNVHPTNNSYDAPNIAELFKQLPQFEFVWAASLHKLELNEYGSLTAPIQKGKDKLVDDAKTVQYALYSNNHTTRLIETEANAEKSTAKIVSTIFPYIRTFESPSLLAWMTKPDLEEFKKNLNSADKTLPKKVQESIVYYRYVNQGFVAIGENANVEKIVSGGVENVANALKSAKNQETILVKDVSHQTKGFELSQGGSFAINLFEKNARMLISSDANAKIDALNFVADDNSKFIDVRLPPIFYKKDGKNVRLPIDYAMAYSSNSNVVLISRTSNDDVINTFDGKIANQKENYKKLWLALNQNADFSVERKSYSGALNWADKVVISRKKCTPMRMLADTHYKLMSNFADKVYFNVDKSGSGKRKERVDLLDGYVAAIQLILCDPSRDLFQTPFKTRIEQSKFKSFMNVLRGVLFDIKTFFNKDISQFYDARNKQNPIKGKNMTEASTDFKVLPNTRDFLPSIDTNKPDDLSLGLSSSKDNKINKQLFFDGAFYSNSVKDNLQPINLPIARPEDKTKKYKLAKFWPTDSSAGDREYGRSLYVRTNATVESRLNADANAGHNVIALAPFIDGAPKAISDIKKIDMRGIVPKVISLSDKENVLDCLYFYHKAAVGLGSLNGGLDDGSKRNDFSIEMNPFLINPYTGTYTTDAKILKDCGFDVSNTKVRAYESFVALRKEYYALRFVSLLSCCFENLNERDVKTESVGTTIVFENAFAKMCKVFFGEKLSAVDNTEARQYFLSLLGLDRESSNKDIGLNFQKLVFFENNPFVRIVKRNHKGATFFKYEDSPFELSRVYYTDPSVRKQVDEDFQRPYTYDVAYEQAKKNMVLPEDKNSEEAKELTKTYYASLSRESQLEIYKDSQDMFNAQQTFLNSIMIPGLGIPKEWKDFICAKGKGMPMPRPKDGDKFLDSIAQTWNDVGLSEKDMFANLCDSNFETDENTQMPMSTSTPRSTPTPTTTSKQPLVSQGRQIPMQDKNVLPIQDNVGEQQGAKSIQSAQDNQSVENQSANREAQQPTSSNSKTPMIIGGAIALSALGYLGYKYLGNKEKK